jgi:glycosyltransferase involved in cell wall biosynthesis
MRITVVLPYAGLQGGVRVVAAHAQRLAQRGHRVLVISSPQVATVRRKLKSLMLNREWPQPEPSYFDGTDVEHKVLNMARPVTDADVPDGDVVVATYYTTAPGVLRLSPEKGAKAIFIQGYEVEEGKANADLDAAWRMPMHKITISRWLVELAANTFGDPVVSLVPNSVDLNEFHAPPRGKQPTPTIGILYSTSPFKGLNVSLDALRQVLARMPSVRIVSFGAERPSLRLPLPRYAEYHYRPSKEEIRRLYAECDVWMCGSIVEGFHLPPLEAMACRCPVVSTRVGWPADAIRDGVNGYLVNVKDAGALASGVQCVLNLPDGPWRRMSDAAYQTARTFSWEEATDLFEQALLLTIERRARGELHAGPHTRSAKYLT